MSYRYARPAINESPGDRLRRQGGAMILTLAIVMLLLWTALQRPTGIRAAARPDRPLFAALLPLAKPEPIVPPPARPKREEKPKPVAGGGRPRRAPLPARGAEPEPGHPDRAVVDVLDTTQAPAAWAAPTTDLAAMSRSDGLEIGQGGQAGGGGRGEGAGSGTGSGDGTGPGSVTIGTLRKADWVWKPTPDQLRPFFPKAAILKKVSGKALIACRVSLSTRVHDCRVIGETAFGLDFGTAAIAASATFRVHPPRRNGKPLNDAWVGIPVLWINNP